MTEADLQKLMFTSKAALKDSKIEEVEQLCYEYARALMRLMPPKSGKLEVREAVAYVEKARDMVIDLLVRG